MTEAKALRELQRGSEAALEWFIDRYSGYVSAVVFNIIGGSHPREDVEEVCSDVFVSLWTGAGRIRKGSVKAYLVGMARHKSIDRLRAGGHELPLEEDAIELQGPEEQLDKQEERAAVHRAVLEMSQPDREIFLRHYYYCQKIADIALAMSMPESTVKTRLRRGREKLRAVLEDSII